MKEWEKGDKVRCISKEHGYTQNNHYIKIGEVYTIDEFFGASSDPRAMFTLMEINLIDEDGPLFSEKDFELYNQQNDMNEAYDRAMRII